MLVVDSVVAVDDRRVGGERGCKAAVMTVTVSPLGMPRSGSIGQQAIGPATGDLG